MSERRLRRGIYVGVALVLIGSALVVNAVRGGGSSGPIWTKYVVFTDPSQRSLTGSWNSLRTFKFGTVQDIYVGQLATYAAKSAQILSISPYPAQKGLLVLRPALAHLCEPHAGFVDGLGAPENPHRGVHTYFPNATFVHEPLSVATHAADVSAVRSGSCTAPTWGWIERVTSYTNGVYRFRLAVTYRFEGRTYRGLLPHAMTWIIPYNVHYEADATYCPGPRCGYLTP